MRVSSKSLRLGAAVLAAVALIVMAACGMTDTVEWSAVRDADGNVNVDEDGVMQIKVEAGGVDKPLEEFAEASFTLGPKNGGVAASGSRLDDTDGDGVADDLYLSFDLDDAGFQRDGSDFVEQDACLRGDHADGTAYRECATLTIPPSGYVSPKPPATIPPVPIPPGGGSGGGGAPSGPTTTTTTTTRPPSAAAGWTEMTPPASPDARLFYGLAPDPVSGVLLYGGYDQMGNSFDDTWRFDGTTWVRLHPSSDPGLRNSHAMAGDGSGVVVFGGYDDGSTILGDTWVWDGAGWTLAEDGTSGPPARVDGALVPLGGGRYLLFGGADDAGVELADTWRWDGASWTQLSPAASPPARGGHTMAVDPQSGAVVIQGGYDWDPATGLSTQFADTWSYDATANTWTEISVGASAGSRSHAGMAATGPGGPLVLFGGYGPGGYVGTTYVLESGGWVPHTTPPTPGARSGHDLVMFEGADSYALLFGGSAHAGTLGDTWRFADR